MQDIETIKVMRGTATPDYPSLASVMRGWLARKKMVFEMYTAINGLEPGEKAAICIRS